LSRDPPAGPPEGLRAHLDGARPGELEIGRGRRLRLTGAGSSVRRIPRRAVERARLPARRAASGRPLVAICLATHDPPLDLLEIQLASIAAQTHRELVCIVSDDASPPPKYEALLRLTAGDPRFHVFRSERRLGFRGNFEACLARVPEGVPFVALADQDDRWYPDKLERCLAAFRPGVELVYSDARVVTRDGRVISDTFWTWRRNDPDDLGALLLLNAVPGAAAVLRAGLLGLILPFPAATATPFHDHWIACVALARGTLARVDGPLQDYRQHEGNALGHPGAGRATAGSWARSLWRERGRRGLSTALRDELERLAAIHRQDVRALAELARALALRVPSPAPAKARILARAAAADRSVTALLRLALRERLRQGPGRAAGPRLVAATIAARILALRERLRGAPPPEGPGAEGV
jgi:hypothetical protein